jgi:hypothetical protein
MRLASETPLLPGAEAWNQATSKTLGTFSAVVAIGYYGESGSSL